MATKLNKEVQSCSELLKCNISVVPGDISVTNVHHLDKNKPDRVLESELKAESNHIRTIIKARGLYYPNLNGKTFAVFRTDQRNHLVSLVSQAVLSQGLLYYSGLK